MVSRTKSFRRRDKEVRRVAEPERRAFRGDRRTEVKREGGGRKRRGARNRTEETIGRTSQKERYTRHGLPGQTTRFFNDSTHSIVGLLVGLIY